MNIEDNIVGTILSISQFGCIVCGGIVLYVMGIIIFSFIYKDDLKKEKIKTHSCKKVNSIG